MVHRLEDVYKKGISSFIFMKKNSCKFSAILDMMIGISQPLGETISAIKMRIVEKKDYLELCHSVDI